MDNSKDTKLIVQQLNNSVEALKKGSTRQPKNGLLKGEDVESFLTAVFETKVNKLSPEQQEEVDKLISDIKTKDTIEVIDNAVFRLGLNFSFDRGPDYLILRSGLEFILDEKGEGGENLRETLKGSIEALDEGIDNWKNSDVVTEESIVHNYEDLHRPASVPKKHHWWWSKT